MIPHMCRYICIHACVYQIKINLKCKIETNEAVCFYLKVIITW